MSSSLTAVLVYTGNLQANIHLQNKDRKDFRRPMTTRKFSLLGTVGRPLLLSKLYTAQIGFL